MKSVNCLLVACQLETSVCLKQLDEARYPENKIYFVRKTNNKRNFFIYLLLFKKPC